MKTITVRKDITINTGNFTNVKLGAEITTDELDWKSAWDEVIFQVHTQELMVKAGGKPEDTGETVPF